MRSLRSILKEMDDQYERQRQDLIATLPNSHVKDRALAMLEYGITNGGRTTAENWPPFWRVRDSKTSINPGFRQREALVSHGGPITPGGRRPSDLLKAPEAAFRKAATRPIEEPPKAPSIPSERRRSPSASIRMCSGTSRRTALAGRTEPMQL